MDVKLTEIVRATTISLNIKDAPMTALPLIKDAFAKLATDLDMLFVPAKYEAVHEAPALEGVIVVGAEVQEQARQLLKAIESVGYQYDEAPVAEQPAAEPTKRRGRPPKAQKAEEPAAEPPKAQKAEEPAAEPPKAVSPQGEPTPLEQAIAAVEGKEQQGEIGNSAEPATTESTPTTTSANTAATPVTDRDLQTYCVKVAQHYGGAAKVYDLCKPFVEEGAVARPSNIKGDDKRWQFIKAVEADSGVRYLG